MNAVHTADDAYAWRWSEEQAATTIKLLTVSIDQIRGGELVDGVPNSFMTWGATGITTLQQQRYFPTPADLMAEIRNRVARQVVAEAAVDSAGRIRALTPSIVAAALADLALDDTRLWLALVDHGLVEHALEPVAIVAATHRTYPRLTVHVDSLYRRAGIVAAIRGVIDRTLTLDERLRPNRYDVGEILDASIAAVMRATATGAPE